ncbi:fimbria/pilus periplasmic chaperone [Enterobacter quasiroggenkampii]|uniref:fimbria/pilus periplasmic chaperone n=1 Tax=Enterobacter quasiroggenkampii TaxID=2497436 RepID=UPI0021CE9FC9|nr:fimbria/pilus periplasmic chaperone [Enterobacter quasiroggenkampii]MCU6306353.1 fimbria/pilus periplasmic chaperone [Enterobacter quasiroggenkampii]MCU6398433.1 fimbria/pilus periplasmic chaperone [Enterobacter quasiroggenkampii]
MKISFIGLILLIPCFASNAGIAIGGTRFVYEENNPQLNITLENSDTRPYLVKTQIQQPGAFPGAEQAGNSPFIATPPLFVLAGGQQNKIRLVSDGGALPKDKETLFDLVVTAIPSSEQRTQVNTVQVAIRSHLKLIYRPAHLQGNPEKAYQQLGWMREGEGVSIKNPTPYYVTLFDLSVNDHAINNAGVIAPFSFRKMPWCSDGHECVIRWRSINDFGKVLSEQKIMI